MSGWQIFLIVLAIIIFILWIYTFIKIWIIRYNQIKTNNKLIDLDTKITKIWELTVERERKVNDISAKSEPQNKEVGKHRSLLEEEYGPKVRELYLKKQKTDLSKDEYIVLDNIKIKLRTIVNAGSKGDVLLREDCEELIAIIETIAW